jgi:RNase P/RNase MRP subunit p30
MPHRKARKFKGSRKSRNVSLSNDEIARRSIYYDMMVLLPRDADKTSRTIKFRDVITRLYDLGYSEIALVHQIHGIPPALSADQVFKPYEALICEFMKGRASRIKTYRRLHAVVESISDMSYFSNLDSTMLNAFDIISLSASNEEIFQSICCSNSADIITLDYTKGGLPFPLRSNYVQAALQRNIAMEILYSPSIHHISHRKSLIQTVQAVENASRGNKLKVIVSSGGDVSTFRIPGDVSNFLSVLAGLHPKKSYACQRENVSWLLAESRKRRAGCNMIYDIISVSVQNEENKNAENLTVTVKLIKLNNPETGKESTSAIGDDYMAEKYNVEDGFIQF